MPQTVAKTIIETVTQTNVRHRNPKTGKYTSANGKPEGYAVSPSGDGGRARKALNLATIQELHRAFERGGAKAIDKVMRQNPAMFLKMLVLLVPRELQVEHSGGVKAMSDDQIESAIEAIKGYLAQHEAKMVDVTPSSQAPPAADASER